MKYSRRATSVAPSLTLALTAKTAELKEKGFSVITFGVGEPDFNTPQHIIDAAKEGLDNGYTKYTAVSGTTQLKEAICFKLQRDNGLSYAPNQIVVSNGAKHSLFNAFQILLDEGDEVIIPAPYWLTYPDLVTICGGKSVFVPCHAEDGFILSPQQLEQAITPRTRAVLLNSPNNPTGAVYTYQQLSALAEVLKRYPDIWIISDEIYEKLIYGGGKHYSIAQMGLYERTIVINGVSKSYAMTGWRIGYCACPDVQTAKCMIGLQSHETSNPNSIAQYASIAALHDEICVEQMRQVFAARRDLMFDTLVHIPHVKAINADGAFYIMLDVSETFGKTFNGKVIGSASDFACELLENFYVVTIPCEGFGAPNFVRLSYATSTENIVEGLARIASFVGQFFDA